MRSAVFSSFKFRLAIGVVLFLAAQYVRADTETGKVRMWIGDGWVRVYNATPIAGGTARCTYGYIGGILLNLSNEYGKAMFSRLLAAEVAGQKVMFAYTYTSGTNECVLNGVASP